MIKFLEKRVGGLEKEVKAWEDMAITISGKNRQKTKNPTKPNKQKVGFMKKHKPKKWYNAFDIFLSAISAFQNFDVFCNLLQTSKLVTLEEQTIRYVPRSFNK